MNSAPVLITSPFQIKQAPSCDFSVPANHELGGQNGKKKSNDYYGRWQQNRIQRKDVDDEDDKVDKA